MKKLFLLLSLLCAVGATLYAQNDKKETLSEAELLKAQQAYLDSVESVMKYQTGTIQLANNLAKINIPTGFKYLNAEHANVILTDVWGNPPSEGVLGLILPANMKITDGQAYAFIIEWDDMGYVKDDDADEIDYDDLLKEMQDDTEAANEERKEAGYPTVKLVGWAAKPFYDKDRKILHWAKEIAFGETPEHTLNYNIRILGRKGVLVLNAVSSMNQLSLVNKDIDKVLDIVEFTDGNKYGDFNPSADKIAAVGIGGLVAGKVLAKLGILAVIGKFFAPLLKLGKLLVVGIVAGISALWRLITGRRKEEETSEESATETTDDAAETTEIATEPSDSTTDTNTTKTPENKEGTENPSA